MYVVLEKNYRTAITALYEKIPVVEKYILNSKYIHLGIELNWEREKKIYF